MNSLLWLDALQEKDLAHVGPQLIALNQLHRLGCPVENGFVIPDGVMRTFWQKTNWPNETLQDFPSLNWDVFLSQAAQVQSIARTLQQGILAHELPMSWEDEWRKELGRWRSPSLLLTAYLWRSPADGVAECSKMLFLSPLMCGTDLDSFWVSLKTLWAQLFQSQNLHILGHLGLQPEQIHLSVLAQPLENVTLSGWVQITSDHIALEAVPQIQLDLWKGDQWPDCYLYDRLQAQWAEPFVAPTRAIVHASKRKSKKPQIPSILLSKATLQALVKLVDSIPTQTDVSDPLTLAWMVSDRSPSPHFLGFVPDLPLPLHPSLNFANRKVFTKVARAVPLGTAQLLGVGLGVSLGQIAAPVVVVRSFDDISARACRGAIIVTQQLDPLHLPWLQEAVGLLCETGTAASHGAILARELGCPAIVGIERITKTLKTGQWVRFDGREGRIYAHRADGAPVPPPRQAPQEDTLESPSVIATSLFAILSQPHRLQEVQAQSIDGICLVRGEWLLSSQLTSDRHLSALTGLDYETLGQQMGTSLGAMAQAVAPRPVYYRSIDRTPDWDGLSQNPGEQNPSLGIRGTLWHQKDARLFEMELVMLGSLLNQGITNLRLILPFVRSPQEVDFCIQKMRAAGLDPSDRLPLWIMAEVPSVLFSLAQYQQLGIQGITIGSSDLAQLLLGIDRDCSAFQDILAQNQAVLNDAVGQLVRGAAALGLSSILCGDLLLTHQPNAQWLAQLIDDGLTGIAVELDAITATRRAIAQAEQQPP